MKLVALLVIVVFSTIVQSYKIRIIRRRYKHKTNGTALVNEQKTAPVHQELQLDSSGRTYQYKRRYYDEAPDETAIKVIPAPRINRVVANLCKDANKDILVVWETVARVLGLDKGYPIQHRGELRKLTTIIRTFVTLSKEINFEQMPVHRILETIEYNLGRVTHRNDIADENDEAISRPYFGIPTVGSPLPGNEETYLGNLETDRSGFNADYLSTDRISVPFLNTPNLFSNENILEPTNSVNLEDIETKLPFEPSIDSNLIESIKTGRLVELENANKIIPATPSFLDSDELITAISPGENAYDDISTELPLDKETNILPPASYINQEQFITVNTLQPSDSVHDSLEPKHEDDVLENPKSAEDTSDDANTRRSFDTLLDQLIMNSIESSNVTLRKGGHDAIHEDTNLYLDPDNKTPDYLNPHDSAENGVSSEVGNIPFDFDILSLSPTKSEAASLQSNNIDAINSQMDANHLGINTNTLSTSSNSNLDKPLELTPIAKDPDFNLVSVSRLYHRENIGSEKHLDARRLLKIEEDITISPVALHPKVINSLGSTDHIIFRTPDYVQKPFKQITPYYVKNSRMNLDPVEPDDNKTRISTDPIDTSQINPDIMTPYILHTSQRNPNPAVSEDVYARQINLDSIIFHDEDTSVINVDTVNPNHETNQINLDPSDPIDPNALYHVDTNLRNRVDNYDFNTSQINPDIMAPYIVDTSQNNTNPAVSVDVDTGETNLDSIISYVQDARVNFDPVNPNDVEASQINLGSSILYDDVDKNHKNLDPALPYDLINPNAPYEVDPNVRNQVDEYDFDTSQINSDIMAPYLGDTSQRNPNPTVSVDVDAEETNLGSTISYDEDTSVRNFDPDNPNDETNQINLVPSVLYDDVDTSHNNLDPTVPYDPIDRNVVDTNRRKLFDNSDFDISQINADIMAPYVVHTSQRNPNLAASDDVDAIQTNQDSIISYDEDTSVKNVDPVNPNDVETNQINLDPTVPYDHIDRNAPYDVDTNLKNQVNNYDLDTSQINPDPMAPYIVDTSQNLNLASHDVDTGKKNQDSIIFYDEDTSVRNFDPVDHNDVETNQINLDASVLYDDVDTSHKYLKPTVRYSPIDANSPYDVDSNLRNGVDNNDFHTSQINPDIMAPYVVNTNQSNPNPAVSNEVDIGQLNLDTIISYDEDRSVRHFNPFDPSDVKTNQIHLGRSGLYDDVNTSQKNLDPTVPYDQIDSTVGYDADANQTSVDLNVPYNVDTNHINLNPVGPDEIESSQINIDTIAPYDVDTNQENRDPTVLYDVGTSQNSPDPTVPYNVDLSQKNIYTGDANDDQKSHINLGTIVSQDTHPSQRNDYPFIQHSETRKSLHLISPYDVNVQQNLRSPGQDVPYVGKSRTNLDPSAPYLIDTKQRNLHKINANQITRQRNLETNRINLELVDPYEFDISRTHPYSSETYNFDVSRKHTNSHDNIDRSQKNVDPIFLYHERTNYEKNDPNIHIKNKMAQFSLDNRYNLSPEENVDIIVFSILPEILSRYSDCKNKARSLIINELKELVIALESNRCHRLP